MLKKAWSDPVWSKVISAGILAIIAGVWVIFAQYYPAALSAYETVRKVALDSTPVPNWLLVLGAPILGLLLIKVVPKKKALEKPSDPEWRQYTKDRFMGLDWTWSWSSTNQITNVHSLCPNCKCQIDARYEGRRPNESAYRFDCDLCGFKAEPQVGKYAEIERKVVRLAEQEIRTNTWPRVAL